MLSAERHAQRVALRATTEVREWAGAVPPPSADPFPVAPLLGVVSVPLSAMG